MQRLTKTERAEVRNYILSVPGWTELGLGENEDGTWALEVGSGEDTPVIEGNSAPEVLRELAAILEES